MKLLDSPFHQRTVKMGRIRPDTPAKEHLCFAHYKQELIITPPSVKSYSHLALQSLVNVYLNDTLADCVIAGGYHVDGVWTGNAGQLFIATNDQLIYDYGKIGGYVPGKPETDNGCNEQTALNYWTKTGFASGNKLVGWLAVDATNWNEIMEVIYLFENIYFGIELPDKWINPMPEGPGFVWDVAGSPDEENGHCVMGCGYNPKGIELDTWGMLGTLTPKAAATYAINKNGGEAYCMVSKAQLLKGQLKAPNGINWPQLSADFDKLHGN